MKQFYQSLFLKRKSKKNYLKSAIAGLAFLFAGYNTVDAQVSAYSFAQSSGTYTPIIGTVLGTATGNASATNLNSEVYPVTLPFNFNFNGTSYSSMNVSTNGFVTFGATPPSATTTTPISGTVAYDGAISAWGRDISSFFDVNGRTGSVSWETVGTSPNREIVIQWNNFRTNSATAVTTVFSFSFQIRLQETSNIIKAVYDAGGFLVGSTAVSGTSQIGLRGSSNSDFNNRLNATTLEFYNSVVGIANNSTQAFNTTNTIPGMPTAGLTYMWTPPSCFRPSSVTNPTSTINSVDIQWVAPALAPSSGYELYYSTTNTDPISTTTPSIVGITSTSTTIPSLASNTLYYVWVRSVCTSSDKSEWSLAGTAKTLCAPVTTMFENFDNYTTGNIVPDCWARIVGASNTAQTISSTDPASGNRNLYQITSTPANATVVVLPEFSNVNAGTHWLRFKARVASSTGSLDVGYVTNSSDASTFVNIQTISVLNTSYTSQDSEYTVIIPSTVPSNARLAIRNNGTSTVGHYYDDVYWEAKPSCISPTNITVSNITPTSAQIQWNASVTAPANGYDIYYSVNNVPPTAGTVPSMSVASGTSVIINPLNPLTRYFVWVRAKCSTSDFSNWSTQIVAFNALCQPPTITSTTPATICPNSTATLSATADAGAIIKWYDVANGGTSVGTGTSFITPSLSASTNYWVTASNIGDPTNVGATTPVSLGASTATNTSWDLLFTVNSNLTLNSVDVFPGTIGQTGTIEVLTSSGTPVSSVSYTTTVSGNSTPQTVPLNIVLLPGTYAMRRSGTANLHRNSAGAVFPYSTPQLVITGTTFVNYPAYYFYFYNINFTAECESARTLVTATVDANCLSTSETTKKDAIKVYPNPFSEMVNVTKPELVKSVRVSDLSGKLIKTINQPESVIRLNDLSAGMYLLQLDMKDGSKQTIKVIKK